MANSTNTSPEQPDYQVVAPGVQKHPVIFNSPHSGCHYPSDFIAASKLTPLALRKSEDSFVDQLFADMPKLGCPLLKANFPRAFLDVNRGPWELDPKMFTGKLPPHIESKTLRVIGGLGTIARNVSENERIYRKKMPFAEAEKRIERYYFPYHRSLTELIENTRDQFGQSLLIDCHSMPSAAAHQSKSSVKRPDIILGDRYGAACNDDLVDQLERLLNAQGLKTIRNKPYAGGFITQTFGRPLEASHVIQIEINRGLYMDENLIKKSSGFNELKQILTDVFGLFLPVASATLTPLSQAAE